MPFHKKGVRVTIELLNDILADVKSKFNDSEAPAYLKKHLKRITPIFQIINRPRWCLYGQAWAVSRWAKKDIAKRQLKLRRATHPTIKLEDEYYFLIIQINRGSFRGITRRGLRYLVAHELAHILQIVVDEEVDGCYSYSTNNDHDYRWYWFTRMMGGTGSELIPPEEIWV